MFEPRNRWRYVCLFSLSDVITGFSFLIFNAICMQYDKCLHVQYAVSTYLSARGKHFGGGQSGIDCRKELQPLANVTALTSQKPWNAATMR